MFGASKVIGKMKNRVRTIIASAWVATLMAGCATHSLGPVSASVVPDNLNPPSNETLLFSAIGKGVQIYECRAKQDDPTHYEWALKGPEADLFDASGRPIGKHYAGPVWESNDGSKVFGQVDKQADSPDATAIKWLLLKTKKNEGQGVFSRVTSIQRINTVGGKAPAGGCEQTDAGKELRVPYTATYRFYEVK
jgi:hypothetical protein